MVPAQQLGLRERPHTGFLLAMQEGLQCLMLSLDCKAPRKGHILICRERSSILTCIAYVEAGQQRVSMSATAASVHM